MATGGLNVSSQLNSLYYSSDIIEECDVIRSCEPCSRDDSSTKATVFCKICKELLCDDCSRPHTKYKPGRHDIVGIQDMDSVAVIHVVDMKSMDLCQEHGKAIEFYCEDHSKLCCSTCAFKHRKCDNVDEIANISLTKEPEFQVMKHALVKMKSESDYIIADCEKSENELTETIAKFSDEGDEMKDRIVKLFEEARQKMLTEANQFKAKVCMQICERQTAANQIKTQINQILPIYSAILEHGTPEQKYIFLKKTEEQQTAIATQIDEHIKAQVTTNCSLSFSVELLALLKMKNPIFQMNFEQRSSHIEDHGADNVCSQIRPVTLELLVSVDLTKNGDDKQEPHITGLDFMPDGRLVTVDANNNKCIILNERLQRQGTPYKFKSKPYDVVCVSENHIAVTVANMTLCLLSVSPDHVISLTKKIYTSSKFYSVCCLTPTDLVVSTIGEPTPAKMIPMMTIDTEGSDLKNVVFPRKTYKAGESKCTYVQSKNTLVLTDRYAHVVYIYDTVEGTSKAVTDKTIQKPCGVCVGPGDTVLVCCKDTNSIVRLSVEGEILGTYPVNMALPYTVCMSKDALTMAVSNNGKFRKKKLQLFKLLPT